MEKQRMVYAISDLHGNFKALIDVLRKSNFDRSNDILYFLGDFCDGYPEADKVIEELLDIKNLFPIFGNHDLWLKEFIETDRIDKKWARLPSHQETIDVFAGKHDMLQEYFSKCTYYEIYNNTFMCHAGLNPNRLIVRQRRLNYCINRKMWENARQYSKQGIRLNPILDETDSVKIKEIIIGHSPTKSHAPEFRGNIINIDTGAGNGGRATLMDIKTKKYVQSGFSAYKH